MEHPEDAWPLRVAHSLHDGPMQTIVSVALELDGLARATGSDSPPPADEIRATLERLRAASQQATAEIRAIVRELSEDGSDRDAVGFAPQIAHRNGSGDPRDEGRDAVNAASER